MRLIVDSLIALMLVGILATVVLHYRQEHREYEQIRFVHHSLARLQEQTVYYRAMAQVRDARARHVRTLNNDSGFPEQILPTWFDDKLPLNVLVSIRHPWIDLAPPGDHRDHPPDPVIEAPEQAGFWYNPQRGIFRARVPAQFSEDRTLRLYNRVNGTALLALPHDEDPDRQPRPHSFKPDPEQRRASQVHEPNQWDHRLDVVSQTLPAMLSLRDVGPEHTADDESDLTPHQADERNETDATAPSSSPQIEAEALSDDNGDRETSPRRPTLADRPHASSGASDTSDASGASDD